VICWYRCLAAPGGHVGTGVSRHWGLCGDGNQSSSDGAASIAIDDLIAVNNVCTGMYGYVYPQDCLNNWGGLAAAVEPASNSQH